MATGAVTVIRPAGPADGDAIARFQTDCWREAYRGLVPREYLDRIGVPERAARWRDRLERHTRRALVAESYHRLAGVVSWADSEVTDAPRLELKSLYIAADRRGTGLAADLLGAALGQAPAHLWVFDGNDRARAFYRKHGFDPDGPRAIDPDTGLWMLRMSRSGSSGRS